MSKKKSKKKMYKCTSKQDISALLKNPRVPNKYNLTISKIKSLKIGDTSKICSPLFWRNNVVNAWCISFGTHEDSFWIGFYDNGSFEFNFTSYEGMTSYEFEEFYNREEIEIVDDFIIQEKFLETINHLIDEKILIL